MPRKGDITFIPSASKGAGAGQPLSTIPDDVKRDAEEVYFALKVAGQGRMHLEFDTEDEVKEFRRQIEGYCKNRPANIDVIHALYAGMSDEDVKARFGDKTVGEAIPTGGPVKFRQSPVKGAPNTHIDFRIYDIPPEDPNTNTIREAASAVNETAAASDVPAPTETVPAPPVKAAPKPKR